MICQGWHGSCDSLNAGGRRPFRQGSTSASGRSHFMPILSTHDIATPMGRNMSRRRWLAATAGLFLGLASFAPAKAADDTIKVGGPRSLRGTMGFTETTPQNTAPLLIDEPNKEGGVV